MVRMRALGNRGSTGTNTSEVTAPSRAEPPPSAAVASSSMDPQRGLHARLRTPTTSAVGLNPACIALAIASGSKLPPTPPTVPASASLDPACYSIPVAGATAIFLDCFFHCCTGSSRKATWSPSVARFTSREPRTSICMTETGFDDADSPLVRRESSHARASRSVSRDPAESLADAAAAAAAADDDDDDDGAEGRPFDRSCAAILASCCAACCPTSCPSLTDTLPSNQHSLLTRKLPDSREPDRRPVSSSCSPK